MMFNKKIKKLAMLVGALVLLASCDVVKQFPGDKGFNTVRPNDVPKSFSKPAILVFSKSNGFRHLSIEAGVESLKKIADTNGWDLYHTENGAIFNDEDLKKFQATLWLSASGNVVNEEQKKSFVNWVKSGAGFVGVHGTGGDPKFDGQWSWFVEKMIGAEFIGHPMFPQFQEATISIEDKSHPATAKLPDTWVHEEEWYSFAESPRDKGFNILATVDESTYSATIGGFKSMAMGEDHPIVWHNCLEQGRTFYTALGHQDKVYSDKNFIAMLTGAMSWAMKLEGSGCEEPATSTDVISEAASTLKEAIIEVEK